MNLCKKEILLTISEIIIEETQDKKRISKILPLKYQDSDSKWLITGSPFDDIFTGMRFNIFFMHIVKADCEILNVGSQARFALTPAEEVEMRKNLTDEQFEAVYGKPDSFDTGVATIDVFQALRGGLINSTGNAEKFARAIIGANSNAPLPASAPLKAELVGGVWHIYAGAEDYAGTKAGRPANREILVFNRRNAKILSFAP